jgi:hypothetical protein
MKTAHRTQRHVWLSVTAGVVATSALAGAAALAAGLIDMGPAITVRFPFHSAVFGGLALAIVVALPMATAAYLAGVGHPSAAEAAMVAGVVLMGWIAVQLVIIKTFSWLQPAMALAGAAVFLCGWLVRKPERSLR